MASYLAGRCPKCSKWIPLRECEAEDPTFDPGLFLQLICAHCGHTFRLSAKDLEVVPESQVVPSS